MAKYDDASWHYDGDYPDDLDEDAAATHIGMFLAWAILHDLTSANHDYGKADVIERRITPGQYFQYTNVEVLTSDDFTDTGGKFATHYYDTGRYLDDYARLFSKLPSMYHAPDTWDSYNTIEKMIDVRYARWLKSTSKKLHENGEAGSR